MLNCPTCRTDKSVRRSAMNSWESRLKFLGWYAYRCNACTQRFYRLGDLKLDYESVREPSLAGTHASDVPWQKRFDPEMVELHGLESQRFERETFGSTRLEFESVEPSLVKRKRTAGLPWMVGGVVAIHALETIVGLTAYPIFGLRRMWLIIIGMVFVAGAAFIFWYLRKMRLVKAESLVACVKLVLTWICLSFLFDAAIGVVIHPMVDGSHLNWSFFPSQYPWIWISYAVFLLSGLVGRWAYLRTTGTRVA